MRRLSLELPSPPRPGAGGPAVRQRTKLVVLGMMTRHPVGGMVWLTMQHVIGLARLGYDVYYVEAHGATPKPFMTEGDDGADRAAAFLSGVFKRFDMSDKWAYHALHCGDRVYGMSSGALKALYRDATLIFNLHGATTPLPEHTAAGRLVYLGTDPVDREIQLSHNDREMIDLFSAHCAHFTWGGNYGRADCKVPVSTLFNLIATRQPVILDLWEAGGVARTDVFTTVGSWRQLWREVTVNGEHYSWSKHSEFLKFLELPSATNQRFELALAACDEDDRVLLESHGWQVRDGLTISADCDDYRQYILASHGEFTVAKDQNVRLRSGWFSDRSATYLAAGRPVVTQDTGFGSFLPVGAGLFAFATLESARDSVAEINANYGQHSRAALDIAREYFSHDVVLPRMLAEVGV